ncbi:MAG: aspartate/glutamate racemase family protein [Candidatus Dojkabacteria bacterium]
MNQNKIIGILGGMGPQASVKLYDLLVTKTSNYLENPIDNYPEILIDSIPVPNFLLNEVHKVKACQMLINRAKRMEAFGATSLCLACNTVHLLLPELQQQVKVPFISIIDTVKDECIKQNHKKVGLTASPTTLESKLYDNALEEFIVIKPDEKTKTILGKLIVKQINNQIIDEDRVVFNKICKTFYLENELDVLILGCTELPLLYEHYMNLNVIDTLDLLADKLLENYFSEENALEQINSYA